MKRKQKSDSNAEKPAVGLLSREEIAAIASEAARAEIARHARASALPSPETLALIAGNVARSGDLNPAVAVAQAAALYDAASARLEGAMKTQASYEREAAAWADIPRPENFPASLNNFLEFIVRAKTPADATKRFRDFLRDRWKRNAANGKIEDYPKWAEWARARHVEQMTPEERQNPKWEGMKEQEIGEALEQSCLEKKVADDMADWKRLGFRDHRSWCLWAKEYSAWWATQRSNKSRKGGQARAAKATEEPVDTPESG